MAAAAAAAAAAAMTGKGSAAALRTAITLRVRKFLAEHFGGGEDLTPEVRVRGGKTRRGVCKLLGAFGLFAAAAAVGTWLTHGSLQRACASSPSSEQGLDCLRGPVVYVHAPPQPLAYHSHLGCVA